MARFDYYDIANEIATILQADATLTGVPVAVEELVSFANNPNQISVHCDRREADEDQYIAAGTSTVYNVYYVVKCRCYSFRKMAIAIQARDDLVGKVEVALMKNRSVNNKVGNLYLEGGDLPTYGLDGGKGYVSEGDTIVVVRVESTTT